MNIFPNIDKRFEKSVPFFKIIKMHNKIIISVLNGIIKFYL